MRNGEASTPRCDGVSMERWVMVPILTEKESEERFIGQVSGAQRIVLLFVVDQENMDAPAGVVGSKIKRAESTMRELKKKLASLHSVEMNQNTLGNGSREPLEFGIRALVQPGDEVLFSEHS